MELCKSKYSRHVVPKLLQFSDRKTRAAIIQCFYGKVRKLVRHTIAAKVLDEAYGDYATAAERQSLIEEFYGPQYALFKTPERRTIQQIIEAHPDREEKIRKNMYEMLIPLLEKGKCTHTIVHRVLLDFLLIADDKRAAEVVDLVKELVVEMYAALVASCARRVPPDAVVASATACSLGRGEYGRASCLMLCHGPSQAAYERGC